MQHEAVSSIPRHMIADRQAVGKGTLMETTLATALLDGGSGEVVELKETDTIGDALATLSRRHIRCAPIRGVEGFYIGMLDKLDIIGVLLTELSDIIKSGSENLQMMADEFLSRPVTDAMGVSNTTTLVQMPSSTTLAHLLRRFSQSLNRVLIVDKSADCARGIISTTRAIEYMVANNLMGPSGNQTIRDLDLACGEAVTVSSDTSVYDALFLMFNKQIPAVGVVDSHGKLVDVLNDSDVKQISQETLSQLRVSVGAFLGQTRGNSSTLATTTTTAAVTLTDSATIVSVAESLVQQRAHVAYLVDVEGKPLAGITFGDLIEETLAGYQRQRRSTPDLSSYP